MSQSHKEKIEEVRQWLSDNVTVIPEPKEITLNRFDCNWEHWDGSFRVSFDNFTLLRNFQYGLDLTGYTVFSEPGFTSPLGAPATYSAVKMTDKTSKAILEGLKLTFPKAKPCGINRDTGIEITYHSPLSDRISSEELSKAIKRVNKSYSITVPLPV